MKLNREIELSVAARGDLVEMAVSRDVVHNGQTMLAHGTKITARIEGVVCEGAPYPSCFVLLQTESYENAARSGPFHAELETPSLDSQLAADRNRAHPLPSIDLPEEFAQAANDKGILHTRMSTRLPRGYPMIWRTLEVPGGVTP